MESLFLKEEEKSFTFNTEDEYWESLWSHGARRLLEQLNDEMLNNFRTHFNEFSQTIKKPDGYHMPPVNVLYGFGEK